MHARNMPVRAPAAKGSTIGGSTARVRNGYGPEFQCMRSVIYVSDRALQRGSTGSLRVVYIRPSGLCWSGSSVSAGSRFGITHGASVRASDVCVSSSESRVPLLSF